METTLVFVSMRQFGHFRSLGEALTREHKVFPFLIVNFFFPCQQKNYDEADEDCKHGE